MNLARTYGGSGIGVLPGPHQPGTRPRKPCFGAQWELNSNTVLERTVGFRIARAKMCIIWGGTGWHRERRSRCTQQKGIGPSMWHRLGLHVGLCRAGRSPNPRSAPEPAGVVRALGQADSAPLANGLPPRHRRAGVARNHDRAPGWHGGGFRHA